MENKFDAEYFKNHEDEKVRLLWAAYQNMTSGLISEMYLAIRTTVRKWNIELSKGGVSLLEEDNKNFEKAHKYFTEYPLYIKSIKQLESEMMPEELRDVQDKLVPKTVSELMNSK